jgi:hypothetical protein
MNGQSKWNRAQFGITGVDHILSKPGCKQGRNQKPVTVTVESVIRDTEIDIAGSESKTTLYFGQDYPDPIDSIRWEQLREEELDCTSHGTI